MQTNSADIGSIIIISTLVILGLMVFIFLFVILYQRRNTIHKNALYKIEIEKQQALLQAIINTQENERKHFAQELHDSVGQMLSAIKLNLSNLKKQGAKSGEEEDTFSVLIDRTMKLTADSIHEVRNISHGLRPGVLDDFGISEALQDLADKVSKGISIRLSVKSNVERNALDKETELAVYRIAQELLNNTIKYAGATEASVRLQLEKGIIVFSYMDNGHGFNLEAVRKSRKAGLGIRNIESRVKMLNGRLDYQSSAGQGVKVNINIPLQVEKPIQ